MEQQPVIGIDLGVISKSELAVADGSSIEFTRKVSSTPSGLTEGLRKAAGGRQVAIVVEATAMAWFVAAVAALRAGVDHTLYRVSGAKSAALRTFYRSHTKTDRIDAKVLALMPAVDNSLRPLELPSAAQLSLKRLVGLRQKLTAAITRQQNQIRSTLHWAAPGLVKAAGGSVTQGLVDVLNTWPDLRKLGAARSSTIARTGGWRPDRADDVKRAAKQAAEFYEGFVDFAELAVELEILTGQLTFLESQKSRLEQRIAAVHDELYPDDLLTSIPGIGPVVAGIIRAVVGNLSNFPSLAAFRAYTGLVPKEASSGQARRRGRISKAGPGALRFGLYMAADVARHWDPGLAALYRRLMVERGRTHTQALCAVASRLTGRVWAVVKENRPYQWLDLDGNPITRDEARALALSLRVDAETRSRLRTFRKEGLDWPHARQLEAPQDAVQPSSVKLIETALEVVRNS